jgi:hypothetical protein
MRFCESLITDYFDWMLKTYDKSRGFKSNASLVNNIKMKSDALIWREEEGKIKTKALKCK